MFFAIYVRNFNLQMNNIPLSLPATNSSKQKLQSAKVEQ